MDRQSRRTSFVRSEVEALEARETPAIVTATTVLRVPGPTDFVVTVATNPAGHHPPGQQDITEVSNREAKAFR